MSTSSRVLLLLAPPTTTTTSHWRAKLDGGVLALLGGMADGIDEADVGSRKVASNQLDQMSDPIDRLRRLSGNADARMSGEPLHVALVEDDVEVVVVLFVALAVGAVAMAIRPTPPPVVALLGRTLDSSSQLPVRIVVLLISLLYGS